jgi:hypothetical protein
METPMKELGRESKIIFVGLIILEMEYGIGLELIIKTTFPVTRNS